MSNGIQNNDPLKIFGEHDENTIQQMWTCLGVGSAVQGVICADGHLGYAMPVGGVIAYEKHISVSGVGFDIGCGNLAVKLDLSYDDIWHRIPDLIKFIQKNISFGIGRINNKEVDHDLFSSPNWKDGDVEHLKDMARKQLGTVGSGNHYVDLFRDEDDYIWIGVHFGSRGFGHKTATQFLKRGGGKDGMLVPPCVLETDSDLGQQYINAMKLAGEYAYAGREWVVAQIVKYLCAKVTQTVHNHHNYAWEETHYGKSYWVVRKGATPAFPGQKGFIGGSMGDNAVIVEGVDSYDSKASLYSTVHGAGRLHSRTVCKKTFNPDDMTDWIKKAGVQLIGGGLDEAPMAYRRLNEVLNYHCETIRVRNTLKPFLVFMAGKDIRDPYKD
jgi:tRNA-splicing ligase RtcB